MTGRWPGRPHWAGTRPSKSGTWGQAVLGQLGLPASSQVCFLLRLTLLGGSREPGSFLPSDPVPGLVRLVQLSWMERSWGHWVRASASAFLILGVMGLLEHQPLISVTGCLHWPGLGFCQDSMRTWRGWWLLFLAWKERFPSSLMWKLQASGCLRTKAPLALSVLSPHSHIVQTLFWLFWNFQNNGFWGLGSAALHTLKEAFVGAEATVPE